jgi:hypothetical protein
MHWKRNPAVDNDKPDVKPATMTSVIDAPNIFDGFFASEENCEEELVLVCKFTQRYFKQKIDTKQCSIMNFYKKL